MNKNIKPTKKDYNNSHIIPLIPNREPSDIDIYSARNRTEGFILGTIIA